MKMAVNKTEYRALNALRGLPDGAHMLIMTSRHTDTGGELEGSEEDFEELVSFINEELAYDMLSARNARTLAKLCVKIDPACEDWLGM